MPPLSLSKEFYLHSFETPLVIQVNGQRQPILQWRGLTRNEFAFLGLICLMAVMFLASFVYSTDKN